MQGDCAERTGTEKSHMVKCAGSLLRDVACQLDAHLFFILKSFCFAFLTIPDTVNICTF